RANQEQSAQQRQALSMLAGLQATGGYQGATDPSVPTAVAPSDAEAIRMLQAAGDTPMAVNVPNPGNVRALSAMAFPKEYGTQFAKSLFPAEGKTQPLVKIRSPNDPNKYMWVTRDQ